MLQSRLRDLKKHLYSWVDETDELVKDLDKLANDLDDHFHKISIAKISGSSAAICGGILAAVGFGLSFVTFGASLGLSIAGGVIGGSGGLTVSGSTVTEAWLSRKNRKAAEDIVKKYQSRVETLKKECIAIGDQLKSYGKIENDFPTYGKIENDFQTWISFWAKLVIGGTAGAKQIGWDIIGRTILNSLSIASYSDDAILAGARAGATAFKTIGSTTFRGLHIAGGVFGLLLMPVDIYTLVDSSIDLHRKKTHRVSEGIRKTVDKMRKECLSKSEIDIMIEETCKTCSYFDWLPDVKYDQLDK